MYIAHKKFPEMMLFIQQFGMIKTFCKLEAENMSQEEANFLRQENIRRLCFGLLSGEARGLRWIDIDFHNRIVSIEKNCGDT